jgi:tetratricopeptide (TPR) repeat protein
MSRKEVMIALLVGAALNGGCASNPAVEVRAVNMPARRPAAGDEVALARASLAMNNVGLALQQFRQALRAHPGSTDALSGMALCYDAMGRVDLSRRYYEEALALAPADTRLLRGYANALARHGAVAEAQAVISEIALRTRASAAQWVVEPATAKPATPATPSAAPVEVAASEPRTTQAAPPKARLERLSLGEIALVTTGAPLWIALPAATPVRSVRLLNAARRQGFAARHRKQLEGAGWRSVAIGDAPHTRQSSLVLYPTGRRSEARRLADNLRIAAIRPEQRSDILILLGRDLG